MLKDEKPIIEVFLHLSVSWDQNIFSVAIGVDLDALIPKIKSDFHVGDCGPNHERGRFLTSINSSRRIRDIMWTFCQHFVVLTVEFCFNSEDFFVRKNDLRCRRASLRFSEKNFSSFKSFLFLKSCEGSGFSQFVRIQLEISFDDGPHRYAAYNNLFGQLANGFRRVLPHLFPNSLNHLRCSYRSRSPTSRTILRCLSFLNRFTT